MFARRTRLSVAAASLPLLVILADSVCRCQEGQALIFGGSVVSIEELPYHVGIYETGDSPGSYKQICGGTLISPKLVVSAAHCFYDEVHSKQKSKERYRVAAGKTLRAWRSRGNGNAVQFRLVADISMPKRFRGRSLFLSNDIAVLTLNKELVLSNSVRVADVDWYDAWTSQQLAPGSLGVVAGWGITDTGVPSSELRSVSLAYVDQDTCFDAQSSELQRWVTHDKFCAGFANKSISVCPGDSGGGLVFFHPGTNKHFLRGVVSVAFRPADFKELCFAQHYAGFTLINPDQLRSLTRTRTASAAASASECGRRPRIPIPLIAGGQDAQVDEFPWNAVVHRKKPGQTTLMMLCQGSLISSKFVISVAHCFYDERALKLHSASEFRISLGGIRRSVSEDSSAQLINVAKISTPALYLGRATQFKYDVAVVELATEVVFSSAVNPICVDWDNSFEYKQLREGAVGLVAALGATETGKYPDVLRWIEMPYVPLETCLELAREHGAENMLSNQNFCAGEINGTKAICSGDSGAGYWALNTSSQRYYLRGVVSTMIARIEIFTQCQVTGYTLFSQISSHLDWIKGFLLSPELFE